jgi:hypothetical protein
MMTSQRPDGDMPRPGVSRRPLVIACATSAFVLIAACASSPSRAQQPPGAAAVKKAKDRPAAEKAAEKKEDAVIRAQMTEILRPMIRPLFLAELRFIRSASGASEEQTRRMARAAQGPLRAAVAECVEEHLQKMRGNEPGSEPNADAAYLAVQKKLASIAAAHLSPEQLARYRDQVQKRTDYRKQVAIRNLLTELEHELRLTAEQRDKIGGSISSHWDPKWDMAGGFFFEENQVFPELPDPVIVPFLTGKQKAAWGKLEKGPSEESLVELLELTVAEGDPLANDLDPDKAPAAVPK